MHVMKGATQVYREGSRDVTVSSEMFDPDGVFEQLLFNRLLWAYPEGPVHVSVGERIGYVQQEESRVGFVASRERSVWNELELFSEYMEHLFRMLPGCTLPFRTLDVTVDRMQLGEEGLDVLVELRVREHGPAPLRRVFDLYRVDAAQSYGEHMKRFTEATGLNVGKLTQNLVFLQNERGLSRAQEGYLRVTDEVRMRTGQVFGLLSSHVQESSADRVLVEGRVVLNMYNALFLRECYRHEPKGFVDRVMPYANGGITDPAHKVWITTNG